MVHDIDRRRWMRRIGQGLAGSGAAGLLRAVDYDKPEPGDKSLCETAISWLTRIAPI